MDKKKCCDFYFKIARGKLLCKYFSQPARGEPCAPMTNAGIYNNTDEVYQYVYA